MGLVMMADRDGLLILDGQSGRGLVCGPPFLSHGVSAFGTGHFRAGHVTLQMRGRLTVGLWLLVCSVYPRPPLSTTSVDIDRFFHFGVRSEEIPGFASQSEVWNPSF